MSSRAQLDNAQYKIWPPSPAELLQHKMAATSRSSNRHKPDPKTERSLSSNSKRHNSRSSVSGDPVASRPAKSSTTSKSNAYHLSPSTEQIAKPSTHTSSRSIPYSQDLHDPRPRVSSTKNHDGQTRSLKSTKVKVAAQDPYSTFMPPPPPLAPPHSVWSSLTQVKPDTIRKHSSKDKDKDKVKVKAREEPRPQRQGQDGSKGVAGEHKPSVYSAATLGRSFKQRTHDTTKQPKASSSHRRYHTEDGIITAQPQRTPPTEQQRPTILPNQAPQPTATASADPETQAQGADIHQSRNRENRSYSPPPAPLVAPVWLPDRDKGRDRPSKSYKSPDRMPSMNQQSGPSGSDTEREGRSTRNEHRIHQREAFNDQAQVPKGGHKKESRMSLAGWFSRKPPKLPAESPTMPTPASVLFSPLPERTIPPPQLLSLSAGQGPPDSHHPYLHSDVSYHDLPIKTPGASTRSLVPPPESASRKHQRSQSAQLPSKSGSTGTLNLPEPTVNPPAARPPTAGVQLQAFSNVSSSATQPNPAVVAPPRSHTPVVQPSPVLPLRSHTPAHRQQTPATVSSSLPQSNPQLAAPARVHPNHSSHDVNQPHGNYRDQEMHDANLLIRPHTSSAQSYQDPPVNSSRETINVVGHQHQPSVPPRRATTPAISSLPALSQFVTPRPKLNIAQTPAATQTALPQSSNLVTGSRSIPDVGNVTGVQQSLSLSLPWSHNVAPGDTHRSTHNIGSPQNVNPSARHAGQSSQPPPPHATNTPYQRNMPDIGSVSKQSYVDLYPPGYTSVSSITLQAPATSAGANEVKKPGKIKQSPSAEAPGILSDSVSKGENSGRATESNSWSVTLNISPPSSSRADGEGYGISSTVASPGISTTSRSSPVQPPSAQPTPRGKALQIPPTHDHQIYPNQSGVTAAHYSASPSDSYLTVPIHSAHPSPSRHTNVYDSRLLGTPSSSSTIIQPPTPRTKSSHSPLKEPLLQPPDSKDQTAFVTAGTSRHSPSRAIQPQELDGGSPGLARTPSTIPANVNETRSHAKSRTHSLQTQTQPVRANTEPGIIHRTSSQSLQAAMVNPLSLRSVQSPQPNTRSTLPDSYSTQDIPHGQSISHNTTLAEPLRTEATSSSKQELQYGSRSRKRTTSQSSNVGNMHTDPYTPGSRGHQQQTQPASSSRHRREKQSVQAAYSTMSSADPQTPFHRTISNNANHVSSSTQPAPLSRHTPNNHSNVSLPYSPDPVPASIPLSPPITRHHTHQSGSVGRSSRPPVSPAGNSRTASDPAPSSQPPRVAVAGHLSTPAPTPDQLPPPTPAQDTEVLMTPSSLAPTLKRQTSTASRPPSMQSYDSKKKGGLFGLFRSISSSGKQREIPVPVAPQPEQKPAKLRRSANSRYKPDDLDMVKSPGSSTTRVIALPPVVQQSYNASVPVHTQEKKSSPPKGFHPWKLLSKRNRTISTASVEALDGTGIGMHLNSPDESVRSSAASGMYPPLRDPMIATQEWRNREEMDLVDRGTIRRRRPGVTFEVMDDNTSERRPRPQRSSKLR